MKTTFAAIAALAMAGCGSFVSKPVPSVAPCEYAESLAPFCIDANGLSCYGADVATHDNGSVVCVWRCIKLEDIYLDVYGVFNPDPSLHLDTMIATGPAAQCD